MANLPSAVAKAFERLEKEYGRELRIDNIKGKYYVKEASGLFDNITGKRISRYRYIGTITDDGFFVPAKHRLISRRQAMSSIEYEKIYDKFIAEKEEERTSELSVSQERQKFKEGEEFILRALSMNSRIPTPYLSKFLELSAYGLRRDIASLTKQYGIKYTLEIDTEKLGFSYYLIGVKFKGRKPDYQEVKKAAEATPNIQLAMVCSGDYDLLLYVIIENSVTMTKNTFYEIRGKMFPDYDSSWYVMLFYKTYGYVPLHRDFFKLLEGKVWRRSKEIPRKPANMIWQRDYNVLKDLCDDSRQSFTDIDRRRGMSLGATRYAYLSLLENGTIIRPTIAITRFPIRYSALLFVEKTNHTVWENSSIGILHDIIKETHSIDRYALVGDVKNPDGVIYIMPVLKEGDADEVQKALKEAVNGIEVHSTIVTGIAKGMLGYRVFDNNYSSQIRILNEYYKEAMPRKIDYKLTANIKEEAE